MRRSPSQPDSPLNASASWSVVAIAVALSLAQLGMAHDFRGIQTAEDKSIEEGAGLEQQEAVEEDVSAADFERLASFVLIALIGVYCFATCKPSESWRMKPVLALALISLAWVYCSFFWSAEPGETKRELVRVSVYSFTALGLAFRFTPLEVCKILATVWVVSVSVAVAWEFLGGDFRPWSTEYRLTGSLHPNSISRYAMLAGISALAFLRAKQGNRQLWLSVLIGAALVILSARSRTSLASAVLGVTALLLIGASLRRVTAVASVMLVLASFALVALGVGGSSLTSRFTSTVNMGRDTGSSALTGRLPLWQYVLNESSGKHLFGMGYGAFWNVERTENVGDKLEWYPRHAHNVYVETVLGLGVVGLGLIMVTLVAAIAKAVMLANQTGAAEYSVLAASLIAGMINGLAEAAFVLPRDLAFFAGIMILTIAVAPLRSPVACVDRSPSKVNFGGRLCPN